MLKIIISYSAEQEVHRVQETLKRLSWYLEQGYPVALPDGITKDSNDVDVDRAVKDEYTNTDYIECAATIQKEWEAVSKGFEKMRDEKLFHLGNEYTVMLTRYGVGGSYSPDLNQVIAKVSVRPQGGIVGVVVHEIVHMTIQYLIDQHQVGHWRKERLVDLLVEYYFPGLKKMQNIKEDVSMVDHAFEKLFPDMEAITQLIGE